MGQPLKLVTLVNGREVTGPEAERVRIEASYGLKAGVMIEQQEWAEERRRHEPKHVDDREGIKAAMLAVENKLVEAMWVLARLPNHGAKGFSSRNGVAYLLERAEIYANAVSNGGEWDKPRNKPERPDPRSIDAMYEPLGWLAWLGRIDGKMLAAATTSKRGKIGAHVSWRWVKTQVPELADVAVRTLQWRYSAALRSLVAELSIREAMKRD